MTSHATLDGMRFAPEREKLQEIMQSFGLEPIISHFESEGGLRSLREVVLGTQLKLTAAMSPRLFAVLETVRATLKYEEPIDLFVGANSDINALAIYSLDNTPHIVTLTSKLVECMNDTELKFVLGHEIGHIQFRHYRANISVRALGQDEKGESKMPNLLRRRLESWGRLAELSADRAGFVAADGQMEAIVSAFFKISSGLGPEHLRFDISAFLQQLEELKRLERRDSICGFSHPVTPIRVRALQLFREAGGDSATSEALAKVDAEVTGLAKLMEYEPTQPIEVHGRNFILAGGVLVGHADGKGFNDDERRLLVEMLLSLTGDPEAEIAQITSVEQAEKLLTESAAWLKQNAGQERFQVFRYMCHIAAVDGLLQGAEEQQLNRMAELLDIPHKAAVQVIHESLAVFLQARRAAGGMTHKLT